MGIYRARTLPISLYARLMIELMWARPQCWSINFPVSSRCLQTCMVGNFRALGASARCCISRHSKQESDADGPRRRQQYPATFGDVALFFFCKTPARFLPGQSFYRILRSRSIKYGFSWFPSWGVVPRCRINRLEFDAASRGRELSCQLKLKHQVIRCCGVRLAGSRYALGVYDVAG
jgi:hypothetical protein